MSKKAKGERKSIRKQYTGKPGRPREVEIQGGATSIGGVKRISATTGAEGTTGIERLSGGTPKVTGVEIVSPHGKEGGKSTG